MSVFDCDVDPIDDELLSDLAQEFAQSEELAINNMIDMWSADGMSERDIEIRLFLHAHDQELIDNAQMECLKHLWNGGKIH